MRHPVHHLTRGMMRVVAGPAELRAIVGMGYAVTAALAGGAGGGILHLESRVTGLKDGFDPHWEPLIAAFAAELRVLDSALRAVEVQIIGGGDPLQLFPRHARDAMTQERAQALSQALARHGLHVNRVLVGGTDARRIALTVHTGELAIEVGESPAGDKDAPPSATPLAPQNARAVVVNIGCMHVDRAPARLTALLGSCVGLALYDPGTRSGALAHVMLPQRPPGDDQLAKYADTAVDALVRAMTAAGADRTRLQAKIAGGANSIFRSDTRVGHVGAANAETVRVSLSDAGIPLLAEDIGGESGRRMTVDLQDFRVVVELMGER